ncbi:Xaa-Pro peptidase family protein [Sphingomonas naphthae]|uniref:Xaa-Pro peptidase family protein n=1 Tax=Sphingomonas naphthae TaxID=1813468 RepID=A0ABY7TS66_9SPHN|nr:Xaa-Pro peptidase family protein [Sphingomonas naphthae]WCT75250.1 Xaa-Pro peptidase family protein [Sphingomonas naphthae]
MIHPSSLTRRTLIASAAAAAAGLALPAAALAPATDLAPLPGRPPAITPAERLARVAKAQRLMRAAGIGALLIEPGASMVYFTGVRWGLSERLTAVVIPAEGDAAIVTPFFEAPSVRQTLVIPAEIRTWQEDEDPLKLVAAILRDRGVATKPVAMEERVRFFASDGLARALPDARIVPGAPVVRGCRMVKSPAEIALMQHATDITIAAYAHVVPRVAPGMSPADVTKMMDAANRALGGETMFSLVLMGAASALPHGSREPQVAKAGEVVLMDCGCAVEGYQSDVSRTFVPGGATARQREVFAQVAHGQHIAFEAARIGAPAGTVDDQVRRYYESLGYGPGYAWPGLSHRTGHGIGLDGHEPVNLVHGEATPLAAGMCFSNEPGLYIPGSFGVRIEDCFHMTDAGPKWFSTPPKTIDAPLG